MSSKLEVEMYPLRRKFLLAGFLIITVVLLWRAVDLQVVRKEFLCSYGDARSLRAVRVQAHRGMIVDRNNEPLAISTPVESVSATPHKIIGNKEGLAKIASVLEMDAGVLRQLLADRLNRDFVYIKRHITPDQARLLKTYSIEGVNLEREFRRYYPAGEVTAHIVGFTNIDDKGQEGIELAYDSWLNGSTGSKRVLQDRLGRIVQNVENIKTADPGKTLMLSIDRRLQYLAYRELKKAVVYNKAKGGSLIILNTKTGEIMALVGQPAYNPNNRGEFKSELYRNRSVTDVFEPGSTLKPFTIAAALGSGLYQPETRVETSPGYFKVNGHIINDIDNYGNIDLTDVIKKSSNVGASKIALTLGARKLWEVHSKVGFGRSTNSGFTGESAGIFYNHQNWSEVELATISFGHGIAVTMLQLAQAYSIIASEGKLNPITFLKTEGEIPKEQVMTSAIANQIKGMLEIATQEGGSAKRAAIEGYRVAGKTGTAHKAIFGGYAEDRYMSLFAGMAPASDPYLVIVVVVDEPHGNEHHGGQVAAPIFSSVMKSALRILNIAPDDLPSIDAQIIVAANR